MDTKKKNFSKIIEIIVLQKPHKQIYVNVKLLHYLCRLAPSKQKLLQSGASLYVHIVRTDAQHLLFVQVVVPESKTATDVCKTKVSVRLFICIPRYATVNQQIYHPFLSIFDLYTFG